MSIENIIPSPPDARQSTGSDSASSAQAVALHDASGSAAPPRRAHLTIRPGKAWKFVDLIEVWEFRDLLFSLAGRDLKLRYKQTVLGVAWVVLQPLLSTLIFTLIGVLAKMNKGETVPYFVLTYAAMLGWNLFANIISRSSTVMTANANLVSKVYFPRVILPLASSISVLVDFSFSFGIMIILLLVYHINPFPGLLLLPAGMLIAIMTGLGIGMVTSALAVSYRDIQYILPVFMQMLMYSSTVIFPLSWIKTKFEHHHWMWAYPWYCANPLIGMLSFFRWVLLGRGPLPTGPALWSAACAVMLFVAGLMLFKKMERKFADVI